MAHICKLKSAAVAPMLDHYQRRPGDGRTRKNPNIDPDRTRLNYALGPGGRRDSVMVLERDVAAIVRECEARGTRRLRKDATWMGDVVVTAPKDVRPEDLERFFSTSYRYVAAKVGERNMLGGWVHMDETSPHVHLAFVPVTADGRLNFNKVCPRPFYQGLHKGLGDVLEAELGYRPHVELDEAERAERVYVERTEDIDDARRAVAEHTADLSRRAVVALAKSAQARAEAREAAEELGRIRGARDLAEAERDRAVESRDAAIARAKEARGQAEEQADLAARASAAADEQVARAMDAARDADAALARRDRAGEEARQAQGRLDGLTAKVGEAQARLDTMTSAIAAQLDARVAAEAEADRAKAQAEAAEARLESVQGRLGAAEGELRDLRAFDPSPLAGIRGGAGPALEDPGLGGRESAAKDANRALRGRLEALQEEARGADRDIERLGERVREAGGRLDGLRARAAEAAAALGRARDALRAFLRSCGAEVRQMLGLPAKSPSDGFWWLQRHLPAPRRDPEEHDHAAAARTAANPSLASQAERFAAAAEADRAPSPAEWAAIARAAQETEMKEEAWSRPVTRGRAR